jgi:hypothetical protein
MEPAIVPADRAWVDDKRCVPSFGRTKKIPAPAISRIITIAAAALIGSVLFTPDGGGRAGDWTRQGRGATPAPGFPEIDGFPQLPQNCASSFRGFPHAVQIFCAMKNISVVWNYKSIGMRGDARSIIIRYRQILIRNGTRFSENSDSDYSDYEPERARLTDTMTVLKQKLRSCLNLLSGAADRGKERVTSHEILHRTHILR